ncbi:PREDICTED: ROOT INITIATION DEFECTIVE [Prunus dulcis]|uniref:PREDICTED: ROOT INITIATION DEFECTIVE n=1 Tax=Prunus dulcis TaxID=3755 RepID=A0A5E4EWT7_PRUDU|nr:protein ROOT INITIATION DEFECTIVE 3-like [Prunus dulcis]VVA18951.1 PREDICTED: ROOT INITIATION DEFECTIVE [Prunus dulcis]
MSSSPHEIVLTSSPDGPIIAYDASSGAALAQFTGSRSPRRGLAIVGKSYIAASHISPTTASGSVHLYNWWSSTAFHNLPVPEPVAPLTVTSDGLYLFAGGLSGSVHGISIPSGDVLKPLPAHSKPVSCLAISDDESLLISGSDDGTIVVVPIFQLVGASGYDSVEELILHRFAAHSDSVTAIISGMGLCNSQIISCSLDCTCKFWSLLRGTLLRTIVFPCTISWVALNPTEPEFYVAGSDGSVHKGSLKVGSRKLVTQGSELIAWTPKHGGAVVSVVMVNGGRNLISASEDGSVWVWEVDAGQVIMALGNEMGSISDLVAATGINCSKAYGFGMSNGAYGSGNCHFGSSGKELMNMPIKKILEMEDVLKVAANDRNRAIDMLESAIAMYERLLELILKEAKRGSRNNKQW